MSGGVPPCCPSAFALLHACPYLARGYSGERAAADVLERFATNAMRQGQRSDIIMLKAAKALAAWEGREQVTEQDVDGAAALALAHRIRRKPFEDILAPASS